MARILTTENLPEKERVDFWKATCDSLIGNIELRDFNDHDFKCEWSLSIAGDLTIGQFNGVHQTLERRPSHIKSYDVDHYIVLLESGNLFNLDHCGHERSGRNGIVLIDTARPYCTGHPEILDVIDVLIPRKVLEQALGPARHVAGLAIESGQPSYPMISTFLRSLSQHGSTLDAESGARMSSIAVDLIAAGFAERLGENGPNRLGGAATLCRAQAYISDHLGQSTLNMGQIAAALNMSVRRLQQIAADEGISLMDWLWDRRMQRARSMLTSPAYRPLGIAAVAYSCGFADQAYFSRRFKQRFGLSPSEARAMGDQDGPSRDGPAAASGRR